MHNERKLLSNAETKTELEKERNNQVRESTQFQRSKGPQVNLVPLENRKSPGDEVGPQVPQGGGGGEVLDKVFPRSNHLIILLYTTFDRLRYFFRLPSIDNCILFTYLV